MFRKLLPFLLALAGLGLGTAAGMALRSEEPTGAAEASSHSDAAASEAAAGDAGKAGPSAKGEGEASSGHGAEKEAEAGSSHAEGKADGGEGDAAHPVEYVRFTNQFVIPIVERGQVAAMVVLALSLEVSEGQTERVYELEPKLRDALLQVMFDHANSGGFSRDFTDTTVLAPLRNALREAATRVFGPDLKDVLISDIMRQDN